MRPNRIIALFAVAAVAGCSTSPPTSQAPGGVADNRDTGGRDSAPATRKNESGPSRSTRAANPPATLAAFEVRESAFSDFGMSVKTNLEVKWGGRVEWMVVTGVSAGSSASRNGIALGDQILAIDGREIAELDRDAMLAALFQRKKGDQSRLLVLGRREALPRFLNVVANRPGP